MSSARVPPSAATVQARASPQPTPTDAVLPHSRRGDLKSWWKGFKKDQHKDESKGVKFSQPQAAKFTESPMTSESPGREISSAALRVFLDEPAEVFQLHAVKQHARSWSLLKNLIPILRKGNNANAKVMDIGDAPVHIWGVPLRQSITYANVAISLQDAQGKSYIYGYVPIVVAKCGVYLKEHGESC